MHPSQRKLAATASAMSSRTLAPSKSVSFSSRAEGHISLDGVRAELAYFFDSGGQLFAIVAPIELHVSVPKCRVAGTVVHRRYDDENTY